MLDIPETAIKCFERWSRTRVMVYDFCREFRPVLAPMRNVHRNPLCDRAKTADAARRCVRFDFFSIQRDIWRYRDGCLKICHCNILEWCMPIYADNRLLCILQAGIRQPLPTAGYPLPVIYDAKPYRSLNAAPPSTDRDELLNVMEGLRQVAARLQLWVQTMHREITGSDPIPRHIQIHALLLRNYRSKASLETIAGKLHLSPSRTAHVIKETTGKTLREHLLEYRMRDACLQLLSTNTPICEIAGLSGFTDTAAFHRAFKRRFAMTPRQYRIAGRTDMPDPYAAGT